MRLAVNTATEYTKKKLSKMPGFELDFNVC